MVVVRRMTTEVTIDRLLKPKEFVLYSINNTFIALRRKQYRTRLKSLETVGKQWSMESKA